MILSTCPYSTITELAAADKINSSYLCRVLMLTLLAPDIVEAIMDGRQGSEVTLPVLMEGVAVEWVPPSHAARVNPAALSPTPALQWPVLPPPCTRFSSGLPPEFRFCGANAHLGSPWSRGWEHPASVRVWGLLNCLGPA